MEAIKKVFADLALGTECAQMNIEGHSVVVIGGLVLAIAVEAVEKNEKTR